MVVRSLALASGLLVRMESNKQAGCKPEASSKQATNGVYISMPLYRSYLVLFRLDNILRFDLLPDYAL
ncbi:hypothetical protein [Arcticibacter svalbardensis]|nr:hypothetical protein [Arcticibacter svalbardensis]